jgi:DNA-binding NarL/FixJ family response regulator
MPRHRILVVEDLEQFRLFVVSTLQQSAKFQVIEASDGLEALHKAEEQRPDLVLLDIGLPDLNGIEVARRLRTLAVPPKIVFVSQESSPDVVGEALNLGALGYVNKLRTHSDLLPAIEAALEGRRFVSSGLQIGPSVEAQAQPRHEILFCSDPAALMDALVGFVADALKLGNAALVRAAKSRQNSLHEELRARGIHIDAAIQRGTYAFFDVEEPARIPDAIKLLSEAAAKAGKRRPRVAVWSERTGRLWAEGKTDDAIQLEQRANELAVHHDIDILCPYPSSHEDHPAFERVHAEHSAAFR